LEASGSLSSRIPIIAVSANARLGQIESVRCFTYVVISNTLSILCHLVPISALTRQMLDAGMNGFVSKPFQMAELLSKIEALTGKRAGQRQTYNA
jgi:CheY-like chemotaxis protein